MALMLNSDSAQQIHKLPLTTALARAEVLESENLVQFHSVVRYFIGFFFSFLGPSVHELNYWGIKVGEWKQNRPTKLNPLNQLCLTLMKLKLNSPVQDLAFHFMVSKSLVSKYVITWMFSLRRLSGCHQWVSNICNSRWQWDFLLRLHHSNLLHGATIKQNNTVKLLVACFLNPFHAPYWAE